MQTTGHKMIDEREAVYCFGMDAIKQYGIRKWHNEFFMPLSIDDYHFIRESVFDAYKRVLTSHISDEWKDVVYIMHDTISKYGQFFHEFMPVRLLEKEGYKILYREKPKVYKLENALSGGILNSDARENIKNAILSLKGTLGHERKRGLNVGSNARLKRLYTRKHGISVTYRALNYFLRSEDTMPGELLEGFERIMDIFQNAAKDIARHFNIMEMCSDELEAAGRKIGFDLMTAMRFYRATKENLRSLKGYDCVLASGLGSTVNRIVLKALQAGGNRVVGFTHGNPTGIFYDKALLLLEFPVVNTYVVPTQGIKGFFSDLLVNFSDFPLPQDVEIENAGDTYMHAFWAGQREKAFAAKVKKVMIVESSMNPIFPFFHPALYYPVQLDLSLKVMGALKKSGYYVIMKLHPDRLRETDYGRIYEGFADECISEDFERTYDRADAIVFPHLFTTPLGRSLVTNKKMVYLLYEEEKFIPEAMELLNRRCRPVRCVFDERNRICFDEGELIDALEAGGTRINTEFLEKQLF